MPVRPLPTAADTTPEQGSHEDAPPTLNLAAFSVDLWYEPPPPPPAPVQRVPKPAPKLAVLGIRRDGDGYAALVKVEATNEIRRVRPGEEIAEILVDRIDPHGIFGTFDERPFALRLDGGGP